MSGRILVADDDEILRDFILLGLKELGFLVRGVGTRAMFKQEAENQSGYDLWILDRGLPDGDGLSALRDLRATGKMTPALVLTAMGCVEQRVEGLDAGADDYLTKPFSILELSSRVKALLRRSPAMPPSIVQVGPLELRLSAGRVFSNNVEISLTANEWRLLRLLATQPDTTFDRARIMKEVGISDEVGEVAVDHLVSRLRTKLRNYGAADVIKTVRGLGFALSVPHNGVVSSE